MSGPMVDLSMDPRLNHVGLSEWKTYLNLGAGRVILNHPDLKNHDGIERPGIDLVFDLTSFPWPIEDASYDKISAFHVLEHIDITFVLRFFKECWRVLTLGGHLIIEVPDFDGMVHEYLKGNKGMIERIYSTGPEPYVNHRWGWDASQLIFAARVAGFPSYLTKPGTDYHSVQMPTIRLEAIKAFNREPTF